ncbi:MAG TPA: Glu/Leu/Phe/Val dehydrogenase dimerization domain-containing protein, partial [Thermoleophilaceae bacterium]|nr:Glu/Leu/Phe/Val dehydrogenase dimerization domain-containing protein [Thermoleophilaceae bacterium]
ALRLSRAMTFKSAACGLNVGGGKGVICLEPGRAPTGRARRDVLLDFADTVNVLEGNYITAEDVGTGSKDMAVISEVTTHVTGLDRRRGGSGDPSPYTAMGVEAAMRACCEKVFGTSDLEGRTVAVVGAGRVGSQLIKRLAKAGAKLLVADIDESRRAQIENIAGARWTDPSSAMLAEVDVLAPCALGGVIDQVNVSRLRCRIVCGSANNILAHEGLADDLAHEGILYAPDFIANAGGIINVSLELDGYEPAKARAGAAGIGDTMRALLKESDEAGVTPLAAAYRLAERRLQSASG